MLDSIEHELEGLASLQRRENAMHGYDLLKSGPRILASAALPAPEVEANWNSLSASTEGWSSRKD